MLKKLINKYYNTQFKKNIIRSSFVFCINTFFIFLAYPVYIHYLGINLFAVWSLLAIIISFAELGNFGIGNAIVKYTSAEFSVGNINKVEAYLSNSFYIIIVPFLIILPILIILKVHLCTLLGIPHEYLVTASQIVPYLACIILLYFLNDNLKSILTGIGRLDLSNILFVSSNIVKLLFAIVLFSLGMKLWAMCLSYIIAGIILLISFCIVLRRNGVKIFFWGRFDLTIARKLIVFGGKMLSISILNMFMMPVCKIILAHTNLSAVAYFEIASKAVYAIHGAFNKGIYAVLPKVAQMKETLSNSKEKILIMCKNISLKIIVISGVLALFLGLTSNIWMKIWLGNKYNIEISYCFNIIMFGMLVSLYALPYYYYSLGSGNEDLCLHEAVIRVGLNILLLGLMLIANKNNSIFIYIAFALSTVLSNSYLIFKSSKL